MIKNNTQTIAVFDFDGTITRKDTLFDFITFCFGKPKLLLGLFILSPILVAFKLKVLLAQIAKQEMLTYFFGNKDYSFFLEKCELYKTRINKIVRKEAMDKIKWHQDEGHKVIIISASITNWISPWAKSIGILETYGTELEVKDNIVTGKLATNNCYGQEKVNKLLEIYPNRSEYQLYMYGDSKGDKEMLELADYSFYRRF